MRTRAFFAILLGSLFVHCAPYNVVFAVDFSSDILTPGHPAEVRYALPTQGRVTLVISDPEGRRYVVRDGDLQSAGPHVLTLNAAVDRPDLGDMERRVLAPGNYEYTFRAELTNGSVLERSGELRVVGGAYPPVSIDGATVVPTVITPNDDGQNDEATISFRLSREAEVDVYVQGPQLKLALASRARMPAGDRHLRFDGRDPLDRPVPDGEYSVVVVAEDAEGNRTAERLPLRITDSAKAQAYIEAVTFTPRQLRVGEMLEVTVVVVNSGRVPLRTQGPEPGYVYSIDDTFASIERHRYVEKPGIWRVGVDWESNVGAGPRRYPFRWGFGQELKPGERVSVKGYIRMDHHVDTAYPYLYFFAGLTQEGRGYPVDKVGRTVVKLVP